MHISTNSTDPPTRLLPLLVFALGLPLVGCGLVGDDSDIESNGFGKVRSTKKRVSNPQVTDQTVKKLTADNAAFAFDLYGKLADNDAGENFFYSPHSISAALAMTYAGAEGSSESQMKQTLHYDLPEKDLHPAFNKLDQALESRQNQKGETSSGSPFTLRIANSVWGQRGYPFKKPFLDTLAQHYGAGIRTVDFRSKPEPARTLINEWVERKTDKHIKNLLPQSAITEMTRIVLTNAIYFNASWANEFDKSKTQQADFTTGSGQTVQVPMMKLKHKPGDAGPPLTYASGTNWQAVELPYVGAKVSMVVLVPDSGKFGSIESKLSGNWVHSKVFANLSETPVELRMPKFDLESKFSVKKMLKSLGMKVPFDRSKADLTGMSKRDNLYLDDVYHKTFLAIDEEGTEAAAATAVTGRAVSAPQFSKVRVDRPFIFMIRDRQTDAVIFAGRLVDPS